MAFGSASGRIKVALTILRHQGMLVASRYCRGLGRPTVGWLGLHREWILGVLQAVGLMGSGPRGWPRGQAGSPTRPPPSPPLPPG